MEEERLKLVVVVVAKVHRRPPESAEEKGYNENKPEKVVVNIVATMVEV